MGAGTSCSNGIFCFLLDCVEALVADYWLHTVTIAQYERVLRTATLIVGELQRNRKSQTSILPSILATYMTAGRVVLQRASDMYCIIGLLTYTSHRKQY